MPAEQSIRDWSADDFNPGNIHRFCDVVMKGGVTSGVVYPLAICHLASNFILKNIGGTSVGAIAAAITAAAEYRRRKEKSGEGYVALSRLPKFLTQNGTLQTLFTADPGAELFLNTALQFTGSRHIVKKVLLALVQFWWPTLLLGIALYWLLYGIFVWVTLPFYRVLCTQLHWGAGWLMLVGLVPTAAIWYFVTCKWKLDRNDFGWCHGYHPSDDGKLSALTDAADLTKRQTPRLIGWLEAFIQQAAGRKYGDPPLTFGDLRNAPDPDWYKEHHKDEYGIDFRMVTTCLTLGRPFEIPFDTAEPIGLRRDHATDFDKDGKPRPDLYFRSCDMAKLFPPHIVRHLEEHGAEHTRHKGYIRFPAAHAVPLVVAARLSMSFPILFCAVKLYATDVNDDMQPVWFSDGGLTSNFPIHFFDAPLPRWPTFAIDLLGSAPSKPTNSEKYAEGEVFLESRHNPGTINPWNELGKGEGSTQGFLMTIIDTARTWLDETSATLPGNSSRTIGVRLKQNEGGINLAMPSEAIKALLLRGQRAGQELNRLFASADDTLAWQDQRWYRYRGAMSALTRWLIGYEIGYDGLAGNSQADYSNLIAKRFGPSHAGDAQAATKSIDQLREVWKTPPSKDPHFMHDEPKPFPVFAQRRPL